ncbi:lysozyme [Sphingobium sp. PNB]|uniref:lysozyme n=1 Tax=Sphingobium sp. PNB TaxID=863934 RepID=UPI001CA387C3|nr:lysozyme [Sphingobium sp. PNB]MCB4863291.1 lysozyme [Sphingobium sp. PNB]
MSKALFDTIRDIKGSPLTQADVDAVNAALSGTPGRVVSKAGLALIKSFEGLSLKAYPDPATGGEPITIGYGHTGGVKLGTVWTQAQADNALADDVSRFANGVAKLIGDAPTTQGQYDAMVSLSYNVGLGNFGSSTLLKKHKAGDHAGAAAEFARWNKAAGKIMAGLTRRRAAEAAMYRGEA